MVECPVCGRLYLVCLEVVVDEDDEERGADEMVREFRDSLRRQRDVTRKGGDEVPVVKTMQQRRCSSGAHEVGTAMADSRYRLAFAFDDDGGLEVLVFDDANACEPVDRAKVGEDLDREGLELALERLLGDDEQGQVQC